MTASEHPFRYTRVSSMNWRRVRQHVSIFSVFLVLSGTMGAAHAKAAAHEIARSQKAPSLDQILDALTDSGLNYEGLDRSNLAIDQIVQKANRLIAKAARQRNKELKGKNPDSPLSKLLSLQAIVTLTDSNSYLLKLKELQLALIATQSLADGPEIDTDEARKELNVEFDAIWTDLRDLKLGVKTLPLRQRAIVDVFVWDLSSKLYSAIRRIRSSTLQVGTALSLESESDLDVAF